MNNSFLLLLQILGLLSLPGIYTQALAETYENAAPLRQTGKKYDLVLIHGLANKHRWSDSFLKTCLEIWGSGNVYVIYASANQTIRVESKGGKKLIYAGGKGWDAGRGSLSAQAAQVRQHTRTLQAEYGLELPFSILAHSMGGLLSRLYIAENPGTVASLVTLGTPHHGSPLAESLYWASRILGAGAAVANLKPSFLSQFNREYPAAAAPLAEQGRIFTVRGTPECSDCFGFVGELFAGCQILAKAYKTPNDGLVPDESALIEGAEHIADFPHYDHLDLVREPAVARKAAEYLP